MVVSNAASIGPIGGGRLIVPLTLSASVNPIVAGSGGDVVRPIVALIIVSQTPVRNSKEKLRCELLFCA